MLFNNVSALFALGNGLWPLRKVAALQAARDAERELVQRWEAEPWRSA
jgi:hypothetical protein